MDKSCSVVGWMPKTYLRPFERNLSGTVARTHLARRPPLFVLFVLSLLASYASSFNFGLLELN